MYVFSSRMAEKTQVRCYDLFCSFLSVWEELQTVSCKRFRVGRLFKCYKALWKYRITSYAFNFAINSSPHFLWNCKGTAFCPGEHNWKCEAAQALPTQNCLFRSRSFFTAALSGLCCAWIPGRMHRVHMGRRLSLDMRNCCSEWWNWASEGTSEEPSRNLNMRCCNKMGRDPI